MICTASRGREAPAARRCRRRPGSALGPPGRTLGHATAKASDGRAAGQDGRPEQRAAMSPPAGSLPSSSGASTKPSRPSRDSA